MKDQSATQKESLKKLVGYVPDGEPNPSAYINIVNKKVLGVDKFGKSRSFEDLFYFLKVCKNAGLDPTLKQIYAVFRWSSAQGQDVMTIQTGIDGMRTIAEKSGLYGGSDDAKFTGEIEIEYTLNQAKLTKKVPAMASVTVFKLNSKNGERLPTTASARWEEYYPGEKQGKMWLKMPYLMLSKVAESLALRKAFPTTSQIYVPEEMDQAIEALPEPKKDVKTKVKVNVEKIAKKVEKGVE